MLECMVTPEMVEDVRKREATAKGVLEAKRARLIKLDADRQLTQHAGSLRQAANRVAELRQVIMVWNKWGGLIWSMRVGLSQ